MNYSEAYQQHRKIKLLQDELAEVNTEIRVTEWAYKLAFVATFTVYFVFVWMMYVSDLWGFTSWLADNLSEVAALVIYSVLALTLPLSMALIKEIGYKHFAKYPNPKIIVVLIVGILAFAGIVYESISSSSQQQHIATGAAEKSKTFDAITTTGTGTAAGATLAPLIAEAEKQLARCKEKLKAGREPHCKGDQAKLDGYLAAEQRSLQSAERASVAAIEAKANAVQELKEDAYKPAFKAIRDSFGVSISTGVMLVTFFISLIFEISHLLLILFLSQKLKRREGLQHALIRQESDYMQSTGKTFKQEDFADDSILNMDDVREQSAQPIGFGQPARAFKYQQPKNQPVGFIRTDNMAPAAKASNPNLGTHKAETSTYNRELSGHGIDSPEDKALNQADDKATIQRIINRGLSAAKPEQETVSKPSAEGQDKPSVDTVSKPSVETVSKPSAEGQGKPSAEGQSGLYPEWVKAVQLKQCKPSVRATWLWIQKRISNKETGSRTHDRTRITIMQKAFFSRAMTDGLMQPNPNYRNGGKKYLWID
jgi:hypothetical protein